MDITGLESLLGVQAPWTIRDVKKDEAEQVINVYIDFAPGTKFHCSCCGELKPVYDTSVKRVRYLNLFEYRCYLHIRTPRLDCARDGIKSVHADPWSRNRSHYSFKFEALILRLCKQMPMTAVGRECSEPDSNLWRVLDRHVEHMKTFVFDFSKVTRVCVDETAVKRGQSYVTIFTDYDTGYVLFVTEGRKKEVFSLFYGWLWDHGGHPGNIELFSMDMSGSFQAGRRENFAHSDVVFDRFHIKNCLSDAVDKVRAEEVKSLASLKSTKYIWLKNEGNLTEKQRLKLDSFLDDGTSQTLSAYKLRCSFDRLWEVQSFAVEPLLEAWVEKAISLNLKPVNKFVRLVYEIWDGLLNSITTKITNAVAEGLNSVMQLARYRARGYRNVNNFMNMIYFLGNT